MHNGDIFLFSYKIRDNFFQPLLLTMFAHGMISKAKDEGINTCASSKQAFFFKGGISQQAKQGLATSSLKPSLTMYPDLLPI